MDIINYIKEFYKKHISMRCRIVKREGVDGDVKYVIQQKHFMFRWWWVNAWVNSWAGAACNDTYPTYEIAQQHLCYFDGSRSKDTVLEEL